MIFTLLTSPADRCQKIWTTHPALGNVKEQQQPPFHTRSKLNSGLPIILRLAGQNTPVAPLVLLQCGSSMLKVQTCMIYTCLFFELSLSVTR